MTSAVLKYDEAKRALAEARDFDEVRTWQDKAAAVREYGRRIRDRSMVIDAGEIITLAHRRRGELLIEMRREGLLVEGPIKLVPDEEPIARVTLADLNTTKKESSYAQRLAEIPEDSFLRLVARCRAHLEEHPEKHAFDVLEQQESKAEKRAKREAELAEKQSALPTKRYGVIYADPEWRFETFSRETGMDRAADNHYPTSDLDAIKARPVADIAADDCALFLWGTVPMLPQALAVMEAWGFQYKSHVMWRKDRIGTGYWFRNEHEMLLVGTRGKIPAPAPGTQSGSVIDAPVGRHSAKPDAFYALIEAYFPKLPKIELNARAARPGWDAWGLEAPEEVPHDLETGEIIEPEAEATPIAPAAAAPAPAPDPYLDDIDIPAFLRIGSPENTWRKGGAPE